MAKPPKIPKVAPPPDSQEHKDCLNYALACIREGETVQKAYLPGWQRNYRAFAGMRDADSPMLADWQSDYRSPYVYEQVMTGMARMVDPRPKFTCVPIEYSTSAESARAAERYLAFDVWQDKWPVMQARLVLHAAIFGEAWTKERWLYNRKPRMVRSTMQELMQGAPPTYQKLLTLDDRSTTDICHPYDVLHPAGAWTLEEAAWVAHRSYRTVDEVKRMQRRVARQPDGSDQIVGVYENTDQVRAYEKDRQRDLPNEMPAEHEQRRRGRVEIWEIWSRTRDRLIVVANREIVLRDVQNPFWHCDIPLSCAILEPDVMRLSGISLVDKLRATQQMLWLVENQRLDNTRLTMDMIVLIRDGIDNIDDLVMGPGEKWILPDPHNDVVFPQMPTPQVASESDLEWMRGRLQAIMRSTYMGSGDPSSMGVNQNTASGMLAIQEEAGRSMDFRMAFVRMLCLERLANMKLQNAQQFATHQMLPDVPLDLLAPKMWVRTDYMSDTLNKSMKQAQAQTLLQAFQPFIGTPLPSGKVVNPQPAFELIAEAFDMNVDDFEMDPPPPPPDDQGPHPVTKLIETMQYRDLGAPPATPQQAAILQSAGLPAGPIVPPQPGQAIEDAGTRSVPQF